MRESIDPFASVGISNVFFQLVLGRSTPKEISASLKSQRPPSVVEHLNKLRRMGIVERDEKIGKSQPYRINWRRFADEFLNHISTVSVQRAAMKLEGDALKKHELERESEQMKEVISRLRKEERFRALIRGYYEKLCEDMENGLYPRRTIWGSIYCFEESLGSVLSEVDMSGCSDLVELLQIWRKCAQRFDNRGPRAALKGALEIVLKS